MEGSAVLHRADSEETMELWDVYDIDRQKTGKLAQRVNGCLLYTSDAADE